MNHTLRVVCRPEIGDGFALAGIPLLPAADPVEAAAVLSSLRTRSEVGVLLVEDDLYRGLPERLRESLDRSALPLVVTFPGPRAGERASAEDELVETLRRAIGYRLRLR